MFAVISTTNPFSTPAELRESLNLFRISKLSPAEGHLTESLPELHRLLTTAGDRIHHNRVRFLHSYPHHSKQGQRTKRRLTRSRPVSRPAPRTVSVNPR